MTTNRPSHWQQEIELIHTLHDQPPVGTPIDASKTNLKWQDLQSTMYQVFKSEMDSVVPWFLEQMPPLYHWITPQSEKSDHIVEIIAGKIISHQQSSERTNTVSQIVTLIVPETDTNGSVGIAQKLSKYQAKSLSLITSMDNKVTLCSLHQSAYQANCDAAPNAKIQAIQKALGQHKKEDVDKYLYHLDVDYLANATVQMISLGFDCYQYCQNNENSFVRVTPVEDTLNGSRVRIDIGLKGFPVTSATENVIGILNRYNFVVRRVLANEVRLDATQQFACLQVVISMNGSETFSPTLPEWARALKGIKTLNYVDHGDEFSALLQGAAPRSLNETNLIRAMANWTHIFLTKVNPYYYSLDRVSRILVRNESFLENSILFFRARFDPKVPENRDKKCSDIKVTIDKNILETPNEIERSVLVESIAFIENILKTNYFLVSKGALSFRIDPKILNKDHYPEMPFGIFYMIGRDFRAFQVRYRDIARGGVRVVMPKTSADYDNTLAGLFDEVNGLASAQQLKNKDIPEGGSKCVFVVRPGGNRHLAVKSAVSGLLDLITLSSETGKLDSAIVDRYGKEEIIYLGPDENMTDDLITWTIQHALQRGYKYAYAFMSSKPDFGINHKTYGVTSEGLNVYLDNLLKYLKINPTQTSFKIKMTGGPDGDVAGNELKILYREYGDNARIVAVADGLGAAFDPSGLDWTELLRLVAENKSIVEFSKQKLGKSSKAFVISADTKENSRIRDTLYATAEADIFIPAGGRPYTVKESNWKTFLKEDGTPSAGAIVEGANIFFTPEARKKLVESGVIVIKDSSANKGGVICSSYEIIACLTLSPQEFAAIKPTYVAQTIELLKLKSDLEAKLLFKEWKKHGDDSNLVALSYEISSEINSAKDLVCAKLNSLSDAELDSGKFVFILEQHCPRILVEKFKTRITERLPRAHKIAIISAYMASHLVYKEGLNWIDMLESEQVFTLALDYIDAEQTVEKIIQEVAKSNMASKVQLMSILKAAGAKVLASNQI